MISSVIRAVCGLALLVISFNTYHKNGAAIAAGKPVNLFGATFSAETWQFTAVIGVVALIGLGFLIAGVAGMLRKP